MKRLVALAALSLATVLVAPTAAFAADEGGLPLGFCQEGEEGSAVTGPGPAAKKDRNGNGHVCIYTNPKSGNNRFVDDTLYA